VSPRYRGSLAQAINAGIDMVMVPTDYIRFITTMKSLVQAGTIRRTASTTPSADPPREVRMGRSRSRCPQRA